MYSIMRLVALGRKFNGVLPKLFLTLLVCTLCVLIFPLLANYSLSQYIYHSDKGDFFSVSTGNLASKIFSWFILVIAGGIYFYSKNYYRRLNQAYQYTFLLHIRTILTGSIRNPSFKKLYHFGRNEAAECLRFAVEEAVKLAPNELIAFCLNLLLAVSIFTIIGSFDIVFFVFILALTFLVSVFYEKQIHKSPLTKNLENRAIQLRKIISDSHILSSFNREHQEVCITEDHLNEIFEKAATKGKTFDRQQVWKDCTFSLLACIYLIIILVCWSFLSLPMENMVGEKFTLLLYACIVPFPVQKVFTFLFNRKLNLAALRRVLIVARFGNTAALKGGRQIIVQSQVSFNNVSFGFQAGKSPILNNLNFSLEKGQISAFIVPNESSKTTLLHLILGIATPTEGTITIDKVNFEEIDPAYFRGQVEVLDCETPLLPGTIESNIAPDRSKITDEIFNAILLTTGITDFLTYLPDGLSTNINDPNAILSKGQKARILLAKALLFKPALLVIDSVLEKVDSNSRAAIYRSIEIGKDQRATVVLSTERKFPEIFDHLFELQNSTLLSIPTNRL